MSLSRVHVCVCICGVLSLLQEEMVAAESELERLTSLGETAWIDQDWAASFFEMQFHMSEAMKVLRMC